MAQSEEKWDAAFAKFAKQNSSATFAQYYVANAMRRIRGGKELASLGAKLRDSGGGEKSEFATAGASKFQRYADIAELQPHQRVVDYGCGSLRIGLHFMTFLDAGNYFGLDVTTDFIEIGKTLIAPVVLADKRPQLAAIGEISIAAAAAFGADLVISNAVCYHVHPSEMNVYLGNLIRLTGKPGSRLVFDVILSKTPVRFKKSGWAAPLDYYIERLSPLSFFRAHNHIKVTDERAEAAEMSSAMLEFRRL
jgi:SAM-dependent methyltransferase